LYPFGVKKRVTDKKKSHKNGYFCENSLRKKENERDTPHTQPHTQHYAQEREKKIGD